MTTGSDSPLFQNMDEQEQAYAPQQVPGTVNPALDEHGSNLGLGGTDTSDDASVVPIVPPLGSSLNSVPIPSPAAPDALQDGVSEDATDADAERR